MYTIEYKRDVNLLDITWSGLFTPTDMAAYAEACRACWHREQFQDGYRLRIILTDGQPLPQDTLSVLARAFINYPKSGRTAMVTSSTIAMLQIKRAMMEPHMRIFDTADAALEWLISDPASVEK